VSPWLLLGAALALSLERACYVWIARGPEYFRAVCARPAVAWLGEPVAIVRRLFYAFKTLQVGVFATWLYVHGDGALVPALAGPGPAGLALVALALGVALIAVGQLLAVSVFYRLGAVGTFYGDRLGHAVPWCRAFPFSLLAHPQYVGAVLTIWGVFLMARFPHADWLALPALETVYYVVATHLEASPPRATVTSSARSAKRWLGSGRSPDEVTSEGRVRW
jgi:methylene-fatty-acyl-phospholipid synthase